MTPDETDPPSNRSIAPPPIDNSWPPSSPLPAPLGESRRSNRHTARTHHSEVSLMLTCCRSAVIAAFYLVLEPEDARVQIAGNLTYGVESFEGHDGQHFHASGDRLLAIDPAGFPAGPDGEWDINRALFVLSQDGLQEPGEQPLKRPKLVIECPRCHKRPQVSEPTLDKWLRALRSKYVASDYAGSQSVKVKVADLGRYGH